MNYLAVDKNIAKKYAKAFMLVFPESFSRDHIPAMNYAHNFLKTHKKIVFFLQLPQFNEERKKAMIADLIRYFSLPESLESLIHLLIKHNRTFYFPDVLSNIIELYAEKTNSIEFLCSSTQILSQQQQDAIRKFLNHSLNKEIILTSTVDNSIIAGLRLKSHNYLWEYSVHKQIQALQALKRQG